MHVDVRHAHFLAKNGDVRDDVDGGDVAGDDAETGGRRDENGKKVYGKNKLYSSFNYEKLRMKDLKGDYTSTAYVNVNIITEFSR